MNSGAWSFLSVMVMVAVAVPVRPTSLPAMSLATISNSYVVVGSVWKITVTQSYRNTNVYIKRKHIHPGKIKERVNKGCNARNKKNNRGRTSQGENM